MARFRIIAGTLGGRRFDAYVGAATRPTSERVREALASALAARGCFDDASRVLELYAGTGALSFEALSRGARHATLVEKDRRAVAGLRASAAALQLAERVTIRALDLARADAARRVAEEGPFDLVLADPPYAEVDAAAALLEALAATGALAGALVALEHPRAAAPFTDRALARYDYGDSAITLALADALAPRADQSGTSEVE